MDPVTVGTAVAKYGPAVAGAFRAAFGRRTNIDWSELQRWLAGLHAEGTLSPEDLAAADATRSSLTDQAETSGREMLAGVQTRLRQRGVDSAPAAETATMRVAQAVARGRQHAGDVSEEQKYNVWLGNKRFNQSKLLALAGARVGAAGYQTQRDDAQRAENLNSVLDYIPKILPGGTTADAAGATDTAGTDTLPRRAGPGAGMYYDPATGRFRRYDSGVGRGTLGRSMVPTGAQPPSGYVF